MTLTVYGYVPAWGVPDISPYVTKIVYYCDATKTPLEYKSQDLTKLDEDAPYGKLPYVIDSETGEKVADTNRIIAYLEKKTGKSLDEGLSAEQRAVGLAFDRLVCEHLYFSGVLEPRWRSDEGWEVYIPHIVQGAEVGPELRAYLDAFRKRILAGFDGQGMGRRDSPYVLQLYKDDIDALSDKIGDKKFLLDDKVRTVDVAAYAMLRHLRDQPQKWAGTGYLEGKANIVAYLERMKKEVGQ